MAIRAQSKPHQPVMLRFEDGVAPNRGGPPLGSWQEWLPNQPSIEGTFPKPIIAQGLAAYQRGKVRSLNLRRADIVATVADTETHTTTLTRDTSRPPLGMRCNCTCRYGYDCKHAVAALYMLLELREQQDDGDGGAPPAPNGQLPGTNGHASAPASPAAQNGNGAATTAANGATAPSSLAAKSPAGSPAFVEFLDLLTPHHEAVVPRRRLWIVVGYDERLGVFHARLCLDAPKLHGVARTHADLQQLYRTTRQANLTGEEWDRHDAALLSDASLGAVFGTPADYALARATSEQTQRLTHNFAQLLLRLISHPRLRLDDHLGAHPETMPPVRIALAPLRLRLGGTRDDEMHLDLGGRLVRPDASEISFENVRTVDGTPAWLFDGSTFYLHDGSFSVRVIDKLRSAPTMRLSPPEVPQFLERAHGLLDRETAAGMMLVPED
ncbi:MAG TPA: SWIM zinc finger family protein, partial [Candidatus Eremiobacteraceae bacterium]|nr:SWIM zinc finger family protein [Candidatus Eremiobacteraceae bacterium]